MGKKKSGSLGRWVGMLYRRRDCYFDRQLSAYSIGPGQYRLLSILYRRAGEEGKACLNQQSIGAELGLDKSAVARSMKKLEKQGFITRMRSEDDGRVYVIKLTDKARELHEELWALRRRWTDILGKGFTAKEKEMASDFLQRMAENADDFLCECRKKE